MALTPGCSRLVLSMALATGKYSCQSQDCFHFHGAANSHYRQRKPSVWVCYVTPLSQKVWVTEKQEDCVPATTLENPTTLDSLLIQWYCCVICSTSVVGTGLLIFFHLFKFICFKACAKHCPLTEWTASKVALLSMASISLNGICEVLISKVSAVWEYKRFRTMMIIVIRCELGAWHGLIHREIVRNKFMIPESITEEGSSSCTLSPWPRKQNYVRMDWSPDWAYTSMSWLWILSLRAKANIFRRWHLTERQAAIWANILENGPRTTVWSEEGHFSQWVTKKLEHWEHHGIRFGWVYPGDPG